MKLMRERLYEKNPELVREMKKKGLKSVEIEDGKAVKFFDEDGDAITVEESFATKIVEAFSKLGEEEDVEQQIVALAHSNEIKGIEIFSTGTHNKMKFTEEDIDDIIAAFGEQDFRPAIKIGHTADKPGAPAYGYVTNLTKKVVDGVVKLYADFTSMHDSVVEAIRDGRYSRVSSEIYFNLQRGAKKFRRALKAVALLGAEVPAVANLVPLHKMEFVDAAAETYAADTELDVPTQASFAALEARIAGITNFMERNADMAKKNTAKIAELTAQVAAFKADMEKMKDEEEKKKMKKKCEELETQIAALAKEDEEDPEKAALAARLAESEKQLAKFAQRERERDVKERVEKIAIPSLRPQFSALYNYAMENDEAKVAVFSVDKDGKTSKRELSLLEILDESVADLNKQSEKLFKKFSIKPDDQPTEDNVEAELTRRVDEYITKNAARKLAFSDAQAEVFAADPDLHKRYKEYLSEQAQGNRGGH